MTDSESLSIARIPPRLIAAIIDYLILAAVLSLVTKLFMSPNSVLVITTFVGALYYGIGNSWLMGGQTLGKKTFGLRVISSQAHESGHKTYLTITQSFIRYFFAFGLVILVAEIPQIVFRNYQVATSLYVLEFNMLLIASYYFSSLLLFVLDPRHRAIHDQLARSVVVRTQSNTLEHELVNNNSGIPSPVSANLTLTSRQTITALGVANILAVLIWLLGIFSASSVLPIKQHKYQLEHVFQTRLIDVSIVGNSLLLKLINLDSGNTVADTESHARSIVKHLLNEHLVDKERISQATISYANIFDDDRQMPRAHSFNFADLQSNTEGQV